MTARLCRCGGPLGIHPTRILCAACTAATPRERVERWQTLAGIPQTKRAELCADGCGQPVERVTSGPQPIRCRACRQKRTDAHRKPKPCGLADCGKMVAQRPGTNWCAVRYCCAGHAELAKAAKDKAYKERAAKKAPRPKPPTERECACCGDPFTPEGPVGPEACCSDKCRSRLDVRRQSERVAGAPERRQTAAQVAKVRAKAERCACGGELGADANLLFCRDRCGWSEIVRVSA